MTSIFDRIGTLAERLEKRFGRSYGECRTCGKPTRSHVVGSGVQCHSCWSAGERVVMADGGEQHDATADWPPAWAEPENILNPDEGVYEPGMVEREQFMCHQNKHPFAPWGDRDAPAPCDSESCDRDAGDTADECDHDARKKWGWEEQHVDFETATDWAEKHPQMDGIAYLQSPDDPYLYIDGDDVVDPETGEIHPAFIALVENLGLSYGDISTSWGGSHIIAIGELPESVGKASWQLDDAPWGPHTDPPSVEIYDGTRVNVTTGRHIPGTPREAQPINDEVLEAVLEATGHVVKDKHGVVESRGVPDDYEPTATTSSETTGSFKDLMAACDKLDARRVAERTIVHSWNDSASTSGGNKAFAPTWGPSANGTANIVDANIWQDTGDEGGWGTPEVMAAIDAGIMSHRTADPRKLTGEDWIDATQHLRDLGFDVPEWDPDGYEEATPQGIVPVERLEMFDYHERRKYAKRIGIEWPTVEEVRERLYDTITATMLEGEKAVIASPTGSGKTYSVATTDWRSMPEVTGDKPVIHFQPTREGRDQAYREAQEAGVDAYRLRGRKELCPVSAGKYDPGNPEGNTPITIDGEPISEWIDYRCDTLGHPLSSVHSWAESEVRGDLPCENGDGECPTKSMFDGVPRDDNGDPSHDVVIATHQFSLVPSLRMHTNVVLDEKPTVSVDVPDRLLRSSINEYLDWADAPVDNLTDLIFASQHGCEPEVSGQRTVGGVLLHEYKKGFAERMDDALGEVPPMDWFKRRSDVHSLAPALARGVWAAEERCDGRRYSAKVPYRPPRLDNEAHDDHSWNRVIVDVVMDGDYEIEDVEIVPDFSTSRSLVGLDANPQEDDPYWQADANPEMETKHVLSESERKLYRRFERGLRTVVVGDGKQPMTSDKYMDSGQGQKMAAIVKNLRQQYDEDFSSAITSAAVEPHLISMMKDAGIEKPDTMHYGEEMSRNDFEGETVGYVAGSIDPGDDAILNLLARRGLDAWPVYKKCPHCDGLGTCPVTDYCYTCNADVTVCDTCDGDGEVREHGRTFEGPDAEEADKVLAGVREDHVIQSAGRWARHADDPDDHATVYLMTDAIPDHYVDHETAGVLWTTNDDQQERIEYVVDNPTGTTATEVAEATGCDHSTAWRTLEKAVDMGLLERRPGAGKHGSTIFTPLPETTPEGAVDVDPGCEPSRCDGRIEDYYTYCARITGTDLRNEGEPATDGGETVREVPLEAFMEAPPPD